MNTRPKTMCSVFGAGCLMYIRRDGTCQLGYYIIEDLVDGPYVYRPWVCREENPEDEVTIAIGVDDEEEND